MKVPRSQKQAVASNIVVYSTTCSIVEKAIMHVGVVHAAANKVPVATIVGNIVSDYARFDNHNPKPYGG